MFYKIYVKTYKITRNFYSDVVTTEGVFISVKGFNILRNVYCF